MRLIDKLYLTKMNIKEVWLPEQKNEYQISLDEISNAIVETAIDQGDNLILHSSIQNLNIGSESKREKIPSLRYANEIMDSFISRIGKNGTLFVPTDSIKNFRGDEYTEKMFDYRSSKSRRGLISELVWQNDRAFRTPYPMYNLSGIGPLAKKVLTGKRQASEYAMDKDSPWYYLMQNEGKVAFLGCGFKANSAIHMPEYLQKNEYPRSVFSNKPLNIKYYDPDLGEQKQRIIIHSLNWADKTVEDFCEYLHEKYGIYKRYDFGNCELITYKIKDQYNALCEEIKRGNCWYDIEYWSI